MQRAIVSNAIVLSLLFIATGDAQEESSLPQRIPWTTSRVVGSPEPPLPYTTEEVFTEIEWDRPIYAKAEPGTSWLVVVQQGGDKDKPTKILRVQDSVDAKETLSLLEIHGRLVYGLAFHPDYTQNGYLYVFSNGPVGEPERQNRISRFTVASDDDRHADVASEHTIIEWRSMGHDGGELGFGRDGMLYISSGDGTSDSDVWYSGQDISNLLGGVLRIDVDNPSADKPYSIPKDNPFIDISNARGELWAFGLRNPWRLWVDRESDQIWVGNNGQDMWETAHLIRRGENYGWSVYEGSHPFYANRERGPAPIVAPTIEHHHTVARSLTGGVVYRGKQIPELDGAYIYGDYATGKIWAARHDGERLTWHKEIADTSHQIAGFAITPQEHLVVVDHGGGLFRIVDSPEEEQSQPFPRWLSETGLFRSVKDQEPQDGVVPYSVNTPGWHDGADIERWLALPNDTTITYTDNRAWGMPEGAVIVQTLSYPVGNENRRIETRLLTRQQSEWIGYSYRWNESQDDAVLVSADGQQIELEWPLDAKPTRFWHIPSRAECMTCHSRAVGFVLGLSRVQMDRTINDVSQIDELYQLGFFADSKPELKEDEKSLVDPFDPSLPVAARARSYLHANCSSCHVEAGGGNARMELEFVRDLESMRVVGKRPQHASFGIDNAMLVFPSDPERSILYQRIARRGSGQMPPLGTSQVDDRAVDLIREWINAMEKPSPKFVREWKLADFAHDLDSLDKDRSLAVGEKKFQELGCSQCHRFAEQGGGAGPNLTGVAALRKPNELLESILLPSARITKGFETTVIVTVEGNVVQGRVENETDDRITIRRSESLSDPVTIHKAEIEERFFGKQSLMPTGALNGCEKEEILDLLAYLLAGSTAKKDQTEK